MSPSRKTAAAGALAIWALLLHEFLALLWPERGRYGWTTLSLRDILEPNHPVILVFLIVLWLGILLKLRRLHPGVLRCFLLTAPGPRRRVVRLFGFYAFLAFGGGLVDLAMAYHFAATIGIYCLMTILAAGVLFGGERRPFLGLTLAPTAEDLTARRRRLKIDAVSVILLALLYTTFVYYYEIRDWEYNLNGLHLALFQLVLTAGCIGLAWALLYGRLRDVASSYVRRLVEEAARHPAAAAGAFREVSAHGGVIAAVFVAMRLLNGGIEWLRGRDAWIVNEGSSVFLGVDWYFVSVREWTEMGELFVLAGFLVTLPMLVAYDDEPTISTVSSGEDSELGVEVQS